MILNSCNNSSNNLFRISVLHLVQVNPSSSIILLFSIPILIPVQPINNSLCLFFRFARCHESPVTENPVYPSVRGVGTAEVCPACHFGSSYNIFETKAKVLYDARFCILIVEYILSNSPRIFIALYNASFAKPNLLNLG